MFPKLIDTGGFFLPTYGVLVALAFLVAIWLTGKLAAKAGLNSDKITNLAIYCALAGMAGAKLLMFLFDWRTYLLNPREIFTFSTLQAAGVYQGGLIIAILFAIVYMRRTGLPALLTCDVFAPGLAIGHAIGRLGCLAAGCCWGSVCHRPWAITFTKPEAHELTGVPLGVPLHPAQLYESLAEFVIFGFLYRLFHRPHREGQVIGWIPCALLRGSVCRGVFPQSRAGTHCGIVSHAVDLARNICGRRMAVHDAKQLQAFGLRPLSDK